MTDGTTKSFSTLAGALVLFGLAGSVLAAMVPRFFATGSGAPPLAVFLTAGVAIILFTAGLFYYVDRLGMGFGKSVLVLALGYNALIAAVKLGLAPAAMYGANESAPFDTFGGDPNTVWYYAVVGAVVAVLYFVVFRVMYAVFKRRFRRRAGPPDERETVREGGPDRRGVLPVVVAVVAVALAVGFAVTGGALVFFGLPVLSYLTYVFATFGAVIALALVVAAVLAYKTFDKVEQRAAGLGDATLLANFFWLGLALLLLYHVMWAVFLLSLVSIWPFRTYTPK